MDDGVLLEFLGQGDEVRVLGVTLIRDSAPQTDQERALAAGMTALGRLECVSSAKPLVKQAEGVLSERRESAFAALCRERLELLVSAEGLYEARGWEWTDDALGMGMTDRLKQADMLLDGLLGADCTQAGPLADRAQYLRGRLRYWMGKEDEESGALAAGLRDLGELAARHSGHRRLAMYLGQKIDEPDPYDSLSPTRGAPEWSHAQREALGRMRQIVHWWVNERQADDGQFGGKFGDDVELLRWWAPLALAGDQTAIRGWRRLADGVWRSRHVSDGYAAAVRDVEHAAEFIADTAPMMAVLSDEPEYLERLAPTARHFEGMWTDLTPQGRRHFRSAWFSSRELDARPPRNRDVPYAARATRAMRYLTWRRPDPRVDDLLLEWSQAWTAAAMRTDKGKPRGVVPPSVRFDDEAINGDETAWRRANMLWRYYDWNGYGEGLMLDQLLFTSLATGDQTLLEPMKASLQLIQAEQQGFGLADRQPPSEDSQRWVADKLVSSRFFWSVVEQWRYSVGDPQYDDLIERYGTPYGRFRINGDEASLVEGLHVLLENLRYNTPLLTTEALHTDRVYAHGWEHLKAMLTGDGMPENSTPYLATSWEGTDDDFTALVSEATSAKLEVQIYSHAPDVRNVRARLWKLTPGRYRLRQRPAIEGAGSEQLVDVVARGQRLHVRLPGRQLTTIELTKISAPPTQ